MPNCPILFDASCPNWPNPPVDSVQSMMPLGFRHPFVVSSLSVRLYVCCLIASTRLVSTLFNWTPIIHWLSDSHSCTHTKKRKKRKNVDSIFRFVCLDSFIQSAGQLIIEMGCYLCWMPLSGDRDVPKRTERTTTTMTALWSSVFIFTWRVVD